MSISSSINSASMTGTTSTESTSTNPEDLLKLLLEKHPKAKDFFINHPKLTKVFDGSTSKDDIQKLLKGNPKLAKFFKEHPKLAHLLKIGPGLNS